MPDSPELQWSRRSSRRYSVADPNASHSTPQLDVAITSRSPFSWGEASVSSSSGAYPTTLESLVSTLRQSSLYGPISLIDNPQKIGEGGQFYVFKQEAGFPFRDEFRSFPTAVKRPKFPDQPERLDLADEQLRDNLHHVYLEIKALTSERLRRHLNIVRLLAWTVDSQNWKYPLGLVFELAFSDLGTFLRAEGDQTSCSTKTLLSEDVANGLDAIHDAYFVHGDLKPENVLLFHSEGRDVAKLSDFGFAIEQGASHVGGTKEWAAPEGISSAAADRFTYGLFVWRVFLHKGEAPPPFFGQPAQELATEDLGEPSVIGEPTSSILRKAFQKLLQENAEDRPAHVAGLLQDPNTTAEKGLEPTVEYEGNSPQMFFSARPLFTWEIPALSRFFLQSLYRRFRETQGKNTRIRPLELTTMALANSDAPPERSKRCVLPLLEAGACNGSRPAQDLMTRASIFFRKPLQSDTLKEYLRSAVCSGATYAKLELEVLDRESLDECQRVFHEQGGYVLIYWDAPRPPRSPSLTPYIEEKTIGYNILHWTAAFGDLEALEMLLSSNPNSGINTMTAKQETPLYLACARGAWPQVAALLLHGADATVRCTPFRVSCLHWVFAFDQALQQVAVRALIKAGADIDALVTSAVPFFHYPFELPAGTPLHWAVATASHNAIRVLIEEGAEPLIRNRSDPYKFDDRIRWLYTVGGPDEEAVTFPEPGCHGLSALDLGAIHRDPVIFQALVDSKRSVDVNSADEEGFTVLHRLSHEQVFRTSTQVTYSPFPFRTGTNSTNLTNIILSIKLLNGDIDRFTDSAIPESVKQQRKQWDIPSYTPLMLAMLQSDYELVEALISSGADVQKENLQGETALLCLSHRAPFQGRPTLECVQLLVSHGADVNHHSPTGGCALVTAATHRLLDVFEFLLDAGANVDERKPGEQHLLHTNLNVFGLLARWESSSYDEKILRLLKKYVLDLEDVVKRRSVIELGDINGVTLLHRFASESMPLCVKALLQSGAPVNARNSKSRYIYPTEPAEKQMKEVWDDTPLDAVEASWEFQEQRMRKYKFRSPGEFDIRKRSKDDVVAILKSYGGVSTCKDVKIVPR